MPCFDFVAIKNIYRMLFIVKTFVIKKRKKSLQKIANLNITENIRKIQRYYLQHKELNIAQMKVILGFPNNQIFPFKAQIKYNYLIAHQKCQLANYRQKIQKIYVKSALILILVNYRYKAQEQTQHQQINYVQQFQKLLFDQMEEIQSQTFNEPITQKKMTKVNTFKSFQIFQSQSIQGDGNSPKSSIVIPHTQSFKLTEYTTNQGKTSRSIISPLDNQLQIKSDVSDYSFGELDSINYFFYEKIKSNN